MHVGSYNISNPNFWDPERDFEVLTKLILIKYIAKTHPITITYTQMAVCDSIEVWEDNNSYKCEKVPVKGWHTLPHDSCLSNELYESFKYNFFS